MEEYLFRFIIFLLLTLNMYAADLVTLYRYEGINSVEKEIENKLKDATYWQEYLKDKNVDFGYYEFKKYVLVTQKNQSEIAVYEKVDNDYKLVSKSSVIVGENKGDKYTEGDKKTPEGAYELVQKRVGLDSFYGPFALVTSYPNIFDQKINLIFQHPNEQVLYAIRSMSVCLLLRYNLYEEQHQARLHNWSTLPKSPSHF